MKLFVVLTIVVLTLLCSQAWAYEESRKCIRKNNNVEVCTIRTIQYRRGSLRPLPAPSTKCITKKNGERVCVTHSYERIVHDRRRSLRRACWVEPNGVSRCHTPEQLRQMGHGK
ncbi:hypothetical protein Q1695_005454 [Nippostrongylus brasiliensis]|nr:hypothetical protein Q1695_005454 [Nippostrongylus brasiliensis]